MKRHSGSLSESFSNAIKGVACALKSERNLRIHFVAGGGLLWFARYYPLGVAERGLLLLTITLVVTAELMNTAVERAVDVAAPDFHPLARVAKDVAAGAVLAASVGSAAVGILLFWDRDVLRAILADHKGAVALWAGLLSMALFFADEPKMRVEKKRQRERG